MSTGGMFGMSVTTMLGHWTNLRNVQSKTYLVIQISGIVIMKQCKEGQNLEVNGQLNEWLEKEYSLMTPTLLRKSSSKVQVKLMFLNL